MRLRVLVAGLILMAMATFSFSQYRNSSPSGDVSQYLRSNTSTSLGLKALKGLFDPNRMHMSQSVSFGYASAGGHGFTQGLYMNRLDYQISKPLLLTTHIGYLFQPTGSVQYGPGMQSGFANGNFVGGADLNWQPWSNTSFRLSVYRGMSPDPYYSDFGWGYYGYRPFLDRP